MQLTQSQDEIYAYAISRPLDEKIKQAISLLREYEPMAITLDDRGYSAGNSGGKDSIVLKKIMQMSGVKFFDYYSNTTIDPPELVRFIKQYHGETQWLSEGQNLTRYMVAKGKGLPTRIGRWCCEIYKEKAFESTFRAVGVRADESKRRKGLWQQITIHTKNNKPVISPLLYFTDKDIWDFIEDEKLPYCELYKEPEISRLGCVGCPLAGRKQMAFEFDRWPKYELLWQRGAKDFFNKWKDIPNKRTGEDRVIKEFVTWTNYWDWWVSEGRYDSRESDCQLNLW